MPRPHFTDDEEYIIAHVRHDDRSAAAVIGSYAIWLVPSCSVFAYGMAKDVTEAILTGFVIVLYQLLRFIYYQVKPAWNLRPVIEKYEAAFKTETANRPPSGDVAPSASPEK